MFFVLNIFCRYGSTLVTQLSPTFQSLTLRPSFLWSIVPSARAASSRSSGLDCRYQISYNLQKSKAALLFAGPCQISFKKMAFQSPGGRKFITFLRVFTTFVLKGTAILLSMKKDINFYYWKCNFLMMIQCSIEWQVGHNFPKRAGCFTSTITFLISFMFR